MKWHKAFLLSEVGCHLKQTVSPFELGAELATLIMEHHFYLKRMPNSQTMVIRLGVFDGHFLKTKQS